MKNDKTGEDIYRIVRPHVRRFYKSYKKIIPSYIDEEDFLQEAVLSFIKYNKTPVQFACMDVLRNVLPLDYREKDKNKRPTFIDINKVKNIEDENNKLTPEDIVFFKQIWDKLMKIFTSDENVRYILYRYFIEGIGFSDIGKEVNMSKQLVSYKIESAMIKLRRLM